MRFRLWRRKAETSIHLPRQRLPLHDRPGWLTQPTEVFPTSEPGRAGNLTPAQRWRAGGWRRNGGSR